MYLFFRHIKRFFYSAFMLFPLFVFGQRSAMIRGTNVNVRNCAQLDCDILFRLNTGDQCNILFNMKDDKILGYGINSWYKINSEGREGFIYGAFLDFISDDLKIWKSNSSSGSGVIIGEEVNARICAGLMCNKSFQLNKGDDVRVLAKTKDYFVPGLGRKPWYELEYKNKKGFVYSHFVDCSDCNFLPCDGVTNIPSSSSSSATVIGDRVNIRSCASAKCDVLFRLDIGEQCTYLGSTRDVYSKNNDVWCEIEFNSKKGFISKSYLSIPSKEHRTVKIWALVVGVADYSANSNSYGVTDLNYSDDDAKSIYQFLKSPIGGNVPDSQIVLLRNSEASKKNILYNANRLFSVAGPNDLILVYFSGHGGPNYFMTYDQPLKYTEIKNVIERSPAQRRICIADACYSGTWSKNFVANQNQKVLNDAQLERLYYDALSNSGNGIALFMSSSNNETSLEVPQLGKGLFTYYYIEGLKGHADTNQNQIITIGELSEYVKQKVKKRAWESFGHIQTPSISGFYDSEMPVGVVRQ